MRLICAYLLLYQPLIAELQDRTPGVPCLVKHPSPHSAAAQSGAALSGSLSGPDL